MTFQEFKKQYPVQASGGCFLTASEFWQWSKKVWVAAQKNVEPPATAKRSTGQGTGNKPQDAICSNDICDYCTHDWSQGNCSKACVNGGDFEGRKLAPCG